MTQELRFAFGANWRAFLETLDEERIHNSEECLKSMLEVQSLEGKTFLDIGSGSGLSSLAAKCMGATVRSFDYDAQSVACTQELKRRYYPYDPNWQVEQGSVLDKDYLKSLGQYDVVYSWGVLHHTGNMWQAIDNVQALVKPGGVLFIALYNDQGMLSRFWWHVKRIYVAGGFGRLLVLISLLPYFYGRAFIRWAFAGENPFLIRKKERGMSFYYDCIDWLGGFPFEVAGVGEVFKYFRDRGFVMKNLKSVSSLGNNEFVFVKE